MTSLGVSLWAGAHVGSVVLEEREQVVTAVCGEVGGAQVGQQLIRVGELREQLRTKQASQQLPSENRHPKLATWPCPCPSLAQGC